MTRGGRAPSWMLAPCLVVLFGGAVGLELLRDRAFGEPPAGASVLYVRSGEALRRVALSYTAALSDMYWIRSLQYFGSTRLSKDPSKNYDLLYPLLDITTTLDPHFRTAYRFGAIFLAETYPGGAGRADLAVRLLEKGFRADPSNWRYLQDIGFVYYWWVGDFKEAAAWFKKSSEVEGAPWWMRSMAAVTLTQGGDRRSSRVLWQSLATTPDNDWLRRNAQLRLLQLDALDEIDRLEAIVRAHLSRTGTLPRAWSALVGAGYLRREPVDPAGSPYVLDPQSGAVGVSPTSPLFPLPTGQRAQPAVR